VLKSDSDKRANAPIWLAFAAILAGYLLVNMLFVAFTPPWQVPDEPAHVNVIRQIATDGCCAVIEPGDWQQGDLERLTAARFAPELLDGLAATEY
jgi:hypothetical protein